jgi:hypothetical protein
MSESTATLTLTARYEHFSVGRVRDGEPLSLVLPADTVSRLNGACAAARTRMLAMGPSAGTEDIEDLVELMHALLGGYAKVAAADALSLRSTDTLQQALSEIEQLRREFGQ